MKHLLVAAAVLAAPASAYADPCRLLDDATAAKVDALLDSGDQPMRFVELCEPCGDTVPGVPFEPTHMAVHDQLKLDHQEYDLAYLYVQTSATRYENVAKLVGCAVTGVSPSLRVEAETPDGVLITVDSRPVVARPDPVAEPLIAELPPSLPPPPAIHTHHSTTIVYAVPWLAIAAVAGGAGFLLGIIATLVALALRRRRAMEPRASRLAL